MTVTKEISIKTFPFWAGAAVNRAKLTDEECDRLEEILEEQIDWDRGELWSTTELNDAMWFDFENLCDWLDLNYEEVMARE